MFPEQLAASGQTHLRPRAPNKLHSRRRQATRYALSALPRMQDGKLGRFFVVRPFALLR